MCIKPRSIYRKAKMILGGVSIVATILLSVACTGPVGLPGPAGPAGTPGVAGVAGQQGPAGAVGSIGPAGAAGATGPAGTAGPAGAVGTAGPQGPAASLPAGTDTGMNVTAAVSKPANGTNFVAGERPVVTVTLSDKNGKALSKADFSTLSVYMAGPQDSTKMVTALKLLNASANRSATPHFYIDLLTNNSSDLKVSGNTLTYTLQAITSELPGTYTIGVRAVKNVAVPSQDTEKFILVNTQIGTATVEQLTVDASKCATCHLGSANNQVYMHHVDPGRTPFGSPEIDNGVIGACILCHNNNGYASYTQSNGNLILDVIVNRVHGVHMGDGLQNPLNTDPLTGAFAMYTDLAFPKDVRNCTACHADDNWKTKPSRLGCGTCHDTTWFGDQNAIPAGYVKHVGGAQADDIKCFVCHTSDNSSVSGIVVPIPTTHQVSMPLNKIDISVSKPANGQYFVAGEKPVVTLVVKDDNGTAIDQTALTTSKYSAANLYVYGPKEQSKPVLTKAANDGINNIAATVTSTIAGPWTFAAGDTFKIAVNKGAVQTLTAPTGNQTAAQVVAWLQANLAGTNVTASGSNVKIASTVNGTNSEIDIYNSPVTIKMGWKPAGLPITDNNGNVIGMTTGVTMEPYVLTPSLSTVANNLKTDTNAQISSASINYPLLDVSGLTPGTYMVLSYVVPSLTANVTNFKTLEGFGYTEFQVGTATVEKSVAAGCTDCHGATVMHYDTAHTHAVPFNADYCKACHDYGRNGAGEGYAVTGGTSTNSWAGYGAKPISARVHGVHFSNYLNRPYDIYSGSPNELNGIIFPQDVRNCTKCHTAATSGTWKTEPSQLACMSCHDSDAARAHAEVNTYDPTPNAPGSGDEVESCKTCHGAGKEFAADVVHNITTPYVPPYPREGWKIGQ